VRVKIRVLKLRNTIISQSNLPHAGSMVNTSDPDANQISGLSLTVPERGLRKISKKLVKQQKRAASQVCPSSFFREWRNKSTARVKR
jgi:hypothetical protein